MEQFCTLDPKRRALAHQHVRTNWYKRTHNSGTLANHRNMLIIGRMLYEQRVSLTSLPAFVTQLLQFFLWTTSIGFPTPSP